MNLLTALFNFLGNLVGWRREAEGRKNTEAMQANTTSLGNSATATAAAVEVEKASQGDAKAVEDLRKDLAG